MQEKELITPQGTWKYRTGNDGDQAILFLHGASSSSRIWKNQYALSFAGCKNIFVDLLGYGESEKPEAGYSLANWLAGIRQILEQERIAEVCIVAHSNGVIFAKEYYRAYPGQVTGLILLDGMLKPMIQPPVLEWMRSAFERSDYEAFMAASIQRMPVQGLGEADVELLKNDALTTPKRVSLAEFELVADPETWRELVIHCPTTIVHTNNPMWDEAYTEWLKTIAPGHRLLEWRDAGHFIPLQFPDGLRELIAQAVL